MATGDRARYCLRTKIVERFQRDPELICVISDGVAPRWEAVCREMSIDAIREMRRVIHNDFRSWSGNGVPTLGGLVWDRLG